jgi:mannan endo-1,4-beta-mannosidase
MKKTISILLCSLLTVVSASAFGGGFVGISEGRFVVNGAPYFFTGTNFWYGPILASKGEGGDRERLLRELDFMKAVGIDNLRILAGADGAGGVVSKVEPTLQREPGVYDDNLLDGLDFLMAELGKRDMYAVLYLNNSWEWSGGYSQYLEWSGEGKAPIPAVDGWKKFGDYVALYAKNKKAKQLFANHVEYMITRTNRYTGLRYAEDPAIMSWQIGNEPRGFGVGNKEAFAAWMKETSAQIRSLDPNHLISTGSEGKVGCEDDIKLWETVHADPNIDYMTIHIWPNNWGWIHRATMDKDLPGAISNTKAYIDEHAAVASRYGKPLVMEEFGYPRDGFMFAKDTPTTGRDSYYEAVFSLICDNMESGGPFAGCNFWAWGGFAKLADDHHVWRKGDDYTGDPAQEEQGLNSVFATDTSTIAVISKYSAILSNGTDAHIAVKLRNNIRSTVATGCMFGHQDDTVYGVGWEDDEGRSDVESVCGDYPAVIGFDAGDIELGAEANLDQVPFCKMREEIIAQYRRGGLVTVSWHADNPVTLGDAWDVSDKKVVEAILPGGSRHTEFMVWLDRLAAFFNSLTDGGDKILVLFRPWHENTGSWFWWGADLCTPEQYRRLWYMTRSYLRDKGATHLLWVYSPGDDALLNKNYEERYPGNEFVDLIGFDIYQNGKKDAAQYASRLDECLAELTRLGKAFDKPIAITETGLECVTIDDWWTGVLQKAVSKYPLSYVLVWRNAYNRENHFYAPYPGHPSSADFIKYYKLPSSLFCGDVDLYK